MVYVFLADGFEEIEALTPVDLLRRAGVEVKTVGVTGKTVNGSHGIRVEADTTVERAKAHLDKGDLPEMIVLPGGMPGARNLDASPAVTAFCTAMAKADRFVAAICAAPMVPGRLGLLMGKKAVCFPGFEDTLRGADVQKCPCVRDGNMITGQAMGAAVEFSLALVEALKGEEAADKLRASILY